MTPNASKFLAAVLGTYGAQALIKATSRSTELEAVLLPRTIIAWLNFVSRFDYEGELPGVENTYVSFVKSENSYAGDIALGEDIYHFQGASLYHLAASVSVALGMEPQSLSSRLKSSDIQKVGLSIDLLAKARACAEEMAKLEGTGLPAKPLAPVEQAKPTLTAPAAPGAKRASLPRKPKLPMLKVVREDAGKRCTSCDQQLFSSGKFVGCKCFDKQMSKSVTTKRVGGDYQLTFNEDWDADSIFVLAEILGRR